MTPSASTWYDTTTLVTITATVNTGYSFISWTAPGSISIPAPTTNPATATVTGYGTITANFGLTATETLYPNSVVYTQGSASSGTLSNMRTQNGVYYVSSSTTR